jgi:vitamin B12 transporter
LVHYVTASHSSFAIRPRRFRAGAREREEPLNARWLNAAALVWLASSAAHAATESEAEPGTAPQVIVTATRTAETADATLAAVTVITREDIERLQPLSVADLILGSAGVAVANNGGLGKLTSVFLRGTNSDQVLVLIDGVKVGSATSGTTAFENLPVDQIERIEIVRGPRSSLYGSEAIGGVIQIFTRKGGGATTPYFSAGVGSYWTGKGNVGISGGGERGWFDVSVADLETQGFNACRGTATAGCFTYEPDRDGYRNLSTSLHGGYRFDNGVEVDLHALRAEGKTQYDGTFVNETEFVQQVFGGSVRFSPLDPWRVTLSASESTDDEDNLLNGAFKSFFDTTRDTFSLQNDVALGKDHLATLGADVQDDRVGSDTAFTATSRENIGVFAQYQGTFGRSRVQLSARNDDSNQFGSNTTGSAAWGLTLTESLRLTASYGTAFKAPTFNDLYDPFFGNPNLQPEKSQSAEVGVAGHSRWGAWSLNAFRTRIRELIVFDATTSHPVNINSALIRGIEAVGSTVVLGWRIGVSLTLLDPENQSADANNGNLLPRRAEQSGKIDFDRGFGKFKFGVTVFAEGRRFDTLANTGRMGGYATVDLRGEYELARDWRLQAKIGNLFDKSYETAELYNQPGLNAFVSVRYQPVRP